MPSTSNAFEAVIIQQGESRTDANVGVNQRTVSGVRLGGMHFPAYLRIVDQIRLSISARLTVCVSSGVIARPHRKTFHDFTSECAGSVKQPVLECFHRFHILLTIKGTQLMVKLLFHTSVFDVPWDNQMSTGQRSSSSMHHWWMKKHRIDEHRFIISTRLCLDGTLS